jgi:hypothetical protein
MLPGFSPSATISKTAGSRSTSPSGAGGTSQSLSDGRVATQAVIDLAKRATPRKTRVTRLLGRATQNPLEDGIRRGYISPTETMSRPIELLDLHGGKEIVNNKKNFSAEERPADYQRAIQRCSFTATGF